ncbi:MAG: hypothetical protein IPI68_08075 [Chitinophagaceae bacterium]|nr:hypothetical protein [Chitinophagaceae bacterium]
MKKRTLTHHHESAKIYRHYYRPSFNFIRLLKSVLIVFISGSSAAAGTYHKKGNNTNCIYKLRLIFSV